MPDAAPPPPKPQWGIRVSWVLWSLNGLVLLFVVGYVTRHAHAASSDELRIMRSTHDRVQDLLWFAFLSALAAFATLELVKRLTRVRGLLQREAAYRWFKQRHALSDFRTLFAFLRLDSRGQGGRQFFDLPAEQVAAQVSAAADAALLGRRRGLLPTTWLGLEPEPPRPSKPRPRTETSRVAEPEADELLDAQRVRTAIDQLQIAMGDTWRRYCQGTAFVLAAVYGVGFVRIGSVSGAEHPRYVIVGAIVGGAAAWVIRDLTAIIEKARR